MGQQFDWIVMVTLDTAVGMVVVPVAGVVGWTAGAPVQLWGCYAKGGFALDGY
jgi:hypothetical protein